ncbi:MAG: hypothetical protein JXR78_01665 [Victivallales bacterium]|nr:hypothetical protein [Victivallales bacterium]
MNPDDLNKFPADEQSRLTDLFKAEKFDEYFNVIGAGREQQEQKIQSELESMLE